jgi:UrcA family protein
MINASLHSLFRSTIAMAIAAAATVAIVAGSASPAVAQEPARAGAARSVAIDLSGIDLASPSGEARITAMVERAARRVCSTSDDRGAAANQARRACIETTLARSLPQVAQLADAARAARPALADVTVPNAAVRR